MKVGVLFLKFDMKFLLKMNTYQCYKVDVFLLKFDMKFLLKINAVHLMKFDKVPLENHYLSML